VSFFARLFRRTPPAPVELDVHQQLVLLTLVRFGPYSFDQLFAEAGAIRRTTPADMANAVLKLEAAAVIERLAEEGRSQAQRRYALTRRGKRIARILPHEPKSTFDVYV
jgi:DNA-binding MarR family transcriptional regulator